RNSDSQAGRGKGGRSYPRRRSAFQQRRRLLSSLRFGPIRGIAMRDWLPQVKRWLGLTALLAAVAWGPALWELPASASAEAAYYAGTDRTEKLIAGARKAGTVTVYTSANLEDMTVLGDAFEKKYGVKVRVWRASSEQVVQRGVTEARAGRFDA